MKCYDCGSESFACRFQRFVIIISETIIEMFERWHPDPGGFGDTSARVFASLPRQSHITSPDIKDISSDQRDQEVNSITKPTRTEFLVFVQPVQQLDSSQDFWDI